MRELFYPRSVAVLGVSTRPSNMGRNIVNNLAEFGFEGAVYAVGPGEGEIQGQRIYRSVCDIPGGVDLAVILTPARAVPAVLDECGQKGVRWAVVETAGFREYGQEGLELEAEVVRAAERHGIRFVGPNCIGIINMENGLCTPFPPLSKIFRPGPVSIVAQSGGVGMSALQLMTSDGIGLNKLVSVGNMLSICAEDLLEYLITDEGTELIFLYLESITDGRRLMEIGRRSSKPILVFKANTGHLGQKIALSHTAALSSDDRVVDAALQQAGMLRVHDATSFCNTLKIMRLPPMGGKNLAVISRSGGHAVIAADTCETVGLDLAPFPESFLRAAEQHFRASVIRLTNPLDLGDLFDLEMYAKIAEGALCLPTVDGLLLMHTAAAPEHEPSRVLMSRLSELTVKYQKPVAYYLSAAPSEIDYLRQHSSFPVFNQVVETVRALKESYLYHRQFVRIRAFQEPAALEIQAPPARRLLDRHRRRGPGLLLPDALEVLEEIGIATAPGVMAATAEEAQAAAERLGYPVALKVVAEQVSHKSDVGGVRLNVGSGQVVAAFEEMVARLRVAQPGCALEGVLVQPMVTGGIELILGGRQDPLFGPVVLVGLGGIYVEVLEEVAIRVAPIGRAEAVEMIESLRGAPILQGARGRPRADVGAVAESLLRLAQLLLDVPEIREIDVNPLLALPEGEGCRAVDARIIVGPDR